MAKTLAVVVVLLLAVAGWSSAELSANEQNKCQGEMQKLLDCLQYAQKSAAEPTTKCCKSVSDIRTADAACLCYLIEAIVADDSRVKDFHLDKDRMMALPNVCKLQNTSISDCPGVSPNVSSTIGMGTLSSSSDAYTLRLPLSRIVIYAVFVSVLFIIFPSWR